MQPFYSSTQSYRGMSTQVRPVSRLYAAALAGVLLYALAAPVKAADGSQIPTASSHAVSGESTSVPPTAAQKNAFALGYCLQYSTLHATDFIASVRQLGLVDNDKAAGAMVQDLIQRGEAVRALQSAAFEKAASLIQTLQGPVKLREWTQKNSQNLKRPVSISRSSQKVNNTSWRPMKPSDMEEEEVTAHLMSIIDETGRVQKELAQMLAKGIKATEFADGADAVFSINLGVYTARLGAWGGSSAQARVLQSDARRMADAQPAGTPPDVDRLLRTAASDKQGVPTPKQGAGNLSSLLPDRLAPHITANLRATPVALLNLYQAAEIDKELSKAIPAED